jgi:hypothetical protein
MVITFREQSECEEVVANNARRSKQCQSNKQLIDARNTRRRERYPTICQEYNARRREWYRIRDESIRQARNARCRERY